MVIIKGGCRVLGGAGWYHNLYRFYLLRFLICIRDNLSRYLGSRQIYFGILVAFRVR